MVSVWSYDDLDAEYAPDRHVPDTNPTLPCDWCDRTAAWDAIRDGTDGESGWTYSTDPDVPFLCPDCSRDQRRQDENYGLTDFHADVGGDAR